MDSIAICILRRTICILQKFLGNIDLSKLNPSDLEQKNLYCDMQYAYCMHIACHNMHIAIKIAACILR